MTGEEKTKEQPVNELEALRRRVAELETIDNLTIVHNQRYFQERLKEEVMRSSRYGQEFSVIMFDIDNFEVYSSRFKQAAGDEILEMVGRSLSDCIRNIDIACRYKESKFAVILPHTGSSGSQIVAERLRQTMERVLTLKSMSSNIQLTISLGITSFPANAISGEELIYQANTALATAQQSGGNQSCIDPQSPGTTNTGEGAASQVTENIKESSINIIYAMVSAVDARNRFTYAHSNNVAKYAVATGKALNLSGRQIRNLRISAILHDIGKIGIPDTIIKKPGPLDAEEIRIMRQHPELGANIVSQTPELADYAQDVRHHHERYDGTGYPSGLKGEQIPLGARIIAIAEAYDNMTTSRPYRQVLSPQEAIEELRRNVNTQFDPNLTIAFMKTISAIPRE